MPGAAGSAPLTIADHAKATGDPGAMKFALSIYTGGACAMKELPFKTDPALYRSVQQIVNAGRPSVSWQKINEQAEATKAGTRPVRRSANVTGNFIQCDKRAYRAWEAGKQGPDPIAQQFDAYAATLRIDFDTQFFRGNPDTGDVDAPTGLYYQLASDARAAQYDLSTQCRVDAGAIDISSGAGTVSSAMALLEQIDDALFRVGELDTGKALIFCDARLQRRLNRFLASGQLFDVNKDQFGQRVQRYRGAKFVPMGMQADGSTPIISITENSTGDVLTGSNRTSIFVASIDPMKAEYAQTEILKPVRLPENGVFYEWLLTWGATFLPVSDRAFARVFNIVI